MKNKDAAVESTQRDRIKTEVAKYLTKNAQLVPMGLILDQESTNHIIDIGTSILMHKWRVGYLSPGSFVEAVASNDLMRSVGCADGVNKQCLAFYVTLMLNLGYIA
jgi:hypothetical protein